MNVNALYERVTNSIIKEMEAGTVPWVKPWKTPRRHGSVMPHNVATGRSYSGINIPLLWGAADANCYISHEWMTFQQARMRDATVRKGEKGTQIVFTKKLLKKEDEDENQVTMLRTYNVFNVAQIDGLPPPKEPEEMPEPIRHERAKAFIQATNAQFKNGGDKACYVPLQDFIAIPYQGFFIHHEAFYAVALHELGHWTGAKTRLDRDLSGRFGTKAYAAEELVAEMTAAFLCAHLDLKGELRHASYISNWIELLREDSRAMFTAASLASKAADYLRSFSEPKEEDDAEETAAL
jgi:antirestriction protein ArdC